MRLGCDPEILLVNSHKKFISSVGLIGGSKDFPRDIGEGCAVQEDNVTVEFNTPPCASAEEYVKYINYNLDYIKDFFAPSGLEISITPSAVYENDQLMSDGAKTFGCDPDYNAWKGGKRNPKPHADNPNLRSAGGHIHIEFDGLDKLEVVKAMDWFVGCQMLEFDHDEGRRKLYGKAGAFREKDYGVEYRTASNAWIVDSDKIRWVWAQTEKALQFVTAGMKFTNEQGEMIQCCINKSDRSMLEQLKKELPL